MTKVSHCEIHSTDECATQISSFKVSFSKISVNKFGSTKFSPNKMRPNKMSLLKISSGKICVIEKCITEIGSPQQCRPELGFIEHNTAEFRIIKTSTGQIYYHAKILLSPRIPSCDTLLQYRQLLFVCHEEILS